jgi:hypothetical protein
VHFLQGAGAHAGAPNGRTAMKRRHLRQLGLAARSVTAAAWDEASAGARGEAETRAARRQLLERVLREG